MSIKQAKEAMDSAKPSRLLCLFSFLLILWSSIWRCDVIHRYDLRLPNPDINELREVGRLSTCHGSPQLTWSLWRRPALQTIAHRSSNNFCLTASNFLLAHSPLLCSLMNGSSYPLSSLLTAFLVVLIYIFLFKNLRNRAQQCRSLTLLLQSASDAHSTQI